MQQPKKNHAYKNQAINCYERFINYFSNDGLFWSWNWNDVCNDNSKDALEALSNYLEQSISVKIAQPYYLIGKMNNGSFD